MMIKLKVKLVSIFSSCLMKDRRRNPLLKRRDEALEKVKKLQEQIEEERRKHKEEQDAARKAAEDKAKKTGEELLRKLEKSLPKK